MRIGVNPLIWINDDEPELGAQITLDQCLSEARAAGYAGIELGHRFPTREGELRPLLAGHQLALVSGWFGGRLLERGVDRELEAMRPHVALLRAMGCGTLVFGEVTDAVHLHPVGLSRRPTLGRRALTRYAHELDRLAQRVQRDGVRLAVHHHVGTIVETPEEIDLLLSETSRAVGLVLDTGHLAWGARTIDGIDAVAKRHADRIAHVHLKNVRADVLARAIDDDLPFLDAVRDGVFTVPGDGAIALQPVVAAMIERRYRGWMVVEAEQDPLLAHPMTYARLGYETTARMIAACAAPHAA